MIKVYRKPDYKYLFNMDNGMFLRWGKTKADNPEYSKYGPEILDIEISTICSNGCSFCYKTNTSKGKNMSLDDFKKLFKKFPDTLTQIAFGIGDIDANKDLWDIMRYCRENNIIPNITINGNRMKASDYNQLHTLCGAVAVSLYDYDTCYNAVKELTGRGMKQVNIHALLSEETYDKCFQVMRDSQIDDRLDKLNAIVFLWLKPKGKRNKFHQLKSMKKFKELIDYAFNNHISIGFDSCSSSNFLNAIKDRKDYKKIEEMVEPCESTLFSYYINVDGIGFPCSFSEDIYKGIDIKKAKDFLRDVWFGKESKIFRKNAIGSKDSNKCRNCTLYNLKLKVDGK